ncbi:MAG TPA: DUF5319 family protein [Egibacteraceae bacterium]|nr:DUF5319 family protein [Egibacteraceae bacterium]
MADDDDAYDDEESAPLPLDRREAARVRQDLDDLAAFRHAFEPEGFKGVSLFCQDCSEEHYYGWDMLQHNLQALLESGETPVHEPAYDPKPDEYIDWEYAQGYLDGLADAGSPVLPAHTADSGGCPFCGVELTAAGEQAIYCPACGHHLGPARIARELLARGWAAEDVAELLRGAQVPPLRGLPDE